MTGSSWAHGWLLGGAVPRTQWLRGSHLGPLGVPRDEGLPLACPVTWPKGPAGDRGEGPLPPGREGWRMDSRSRRTPGRGAAAVRPAISGRNAPARSPHLVLSPKPNCCLVGCEGRREGERAGGRAGEGGGLGEGARGEGTITKGPAHKPPRPGLLDCELFSLTHTRTHMHTSAHSHTHTFPHLFPAFPPRLFFRCWPCSRQKERGGPLPGQPSGEEAGGRAWRPGQKSQPQPRPEWPGPRPSGWAPGPVWGHRPAVPRLSPHPGPPDSPTPPGLARDRFCPQLGRRAIGQLWRLRGCYVCRGRGAAG